MAKVTAFLKNDLRLIRRDMILKAMLGFVIYLAVVLRFALPWATGWLADEGILPGTSNAESLSHYYPLVVSFFALYTSAVLGGAVFGFIVLGEKDDDVLKAMLVTPVSPATYLNYRIGASVVVSFAMLIVVVYGVGVALPPAHQMVPIVFAASWTAPIVMLFLVMLADGKLQGLNYSKFISLGGLLILVSWWVSPPLQWLFGLFPPFWPTRAYWAALAGDGSWLLYASIGVLAQWAAAVALRNRFVKQVYSNV